jgi:hypothetical protein
MAVSTELVNPESRRPRDLALLLLAASDEPPRERARDQQADRAGGALRRRILDRIAALDPEPEQFEAALVAIVTELGEPTGPTRSLCALIFQEWTACQAAPEAWAWLLAEAVSGAEAKPRRGKGRRGSEPT